MGSLAGEGSARELSDEAGISPATLCEFLGGSKNPSGDTIDRLAKVLDLRLVRRDGELVRITRP